MEGSYLDRQLAEALPQEVLAETNHISACNKGFERWGEQDYALAKAFYLRSLQIDPQPETWFNLTVCLDDMGEPNEAVQALAGFYASIADPDEAALAEELLKENGKGRLIKPARSRLQTLPTNPCRFGSRKSSWCRDFEGCTADESRMSDWKDFSDPMQVIFGYPEIPGVYAKLFDASEGYMYGGETVFLFAHIADGIIRDVSYSVIYIDAMGEGIEIRKELLGADIDQAVALLTDIVF